MSERTKACEIDGHMVYAVRCNCNRFDFKQMKEEYNEYNHICWKLSEKTIGENRKGSLAREIKKGDICFIYITCLPNKSENGFILYAEVKDVADETKEHINKHSNATGKESEEYVATLILDNIKIIPDVNLRFREDNIETEYEYSLPRRSVQHIYDNLDDKEQKVQRMVNDIYRVVNEDNIFDKLADMFGQN